MKVIVIIWPLLVLLFISCHDESHKLTTDLQLQTSDYYASGSALDYKAFEAKMRFSYFVAINRSKLAGLSEEDTKKVIINEQVMQLEHLFGAFKMGKYQGVPKLGKDQSSIFHWDKITYNKTYAFIPYDYVGNALIDEQLLGGTKLALPRYPSLVYEQSWNGDRNPCTDPHYQSEGDFWYFWNLKNPGCSALLKEKSHYDFVDVSFEKIESTIETYPEYRRLVQIDSRGEKYIPIYLFFGTTHTQSSIDSISTTSDESAKTVLAMQSYLKQTGFNQVKAIRLTPSSLLYKYEKLMPENGITLKVNLFYGNTGFSESNSLAFHKEYKSALERGSVIMYAGHSGLGGNLHLGYLEQDLGKITLPKDQYQILIFDSCSSYPYYNEMYFEKKVGALLPDGSVDRYGRYNLDIVTNGLSSYFIRNIYPLTQMINSISQAFAGKEMQSWQEIVNQIHRTGLTNEPTLKGHLIIISGDEDNSTTEQLIELPSGAIFPSTFTHVVAYGGTTIKTFDAQTDNLAFRDTLKAYAKAGNLVYALSSNGKLYYLDNNAYDYFRVSALNSSLQDGNYFKDLFITTIDNSITIYLIDNQNTLWVKMPDKELQKSSRQHPDGREWKKITIEQNKFFVGVDDLNQTYVWQKVTLSDYGWVKQLAGLKFSKIAAIGKGSKYVQTTDFSEQLVASSLTDNLIVYGFAQDNILYYRDNTNYTWVLSQINKSVIGIKMFTVVLAEGESYLYIVDQDNKLWYKSVDKDVALSSKQHPSGLAWIKLYLNNEGVLIGVDSQNIEWKYLNRQWIKNL